MKKLSILITLLLSTLLLTTGCDDSSKQAIQDEINKADNEIVTAKQQEVPKYAPALYNSSIDNYNEAKLAYNTNNYNEAKTNLDEFYTDMNKAKSKTAAAKSQLEKEAMAQREAQRLEAERQAQMEAEKKAATQIYIVKKGDYLWKISEQVYNDGQQWNKIYQANKDKIDNPTLIYPNQKLNIPQ